ncbi:MAG: lipid biosynthesis B12-binding/radical SAM protein [Candidatus Sumerlaeia bacterium]
MAKIFLISGNLTREPYPVYPIGMAMVAGALREAGHSVVEHDFLVEGASAEACARAAAKAAPDYIGISIRNIDNTDSVSLDSYLEPYRQLTAALRKATNVPIILGGAGYSLFADALLEELGADYGVAGEGEKMVLDLIKALEAGKAPAHRVLRSNQPLNAGDIHAHNRNAVLTDYYLREGGMLNIQTKRGCPHRCAYCTYPLIEGPTYRHRSPTAVADEFEALRDQYKADYIAITDSVFNDAQNRYLEIAEELARRENPIPWMCFMRPQAFKISEVELLYRAGLRSVEWGTDCSTDATLQGMQKDFTWEEVVHSNRLFAGSGIANGHFIIFGGPDETPDTVSRGLENIAALDHCVVFAFCGVRILPGTAIHRRSIEEGLIEADRKLLDAAFYFSPQVERESVHRAILESFEGRMDRVYPPGQDLAKIQAFHRMGYRGPVWDMLLAGNRRRKENAS